jgi:hypothetical protein
MLHHREVSGILQAKGIAVVSDRWLPSTSARSAEDGNRQQEEKEQSSHFILSSIRYFQV